MSVHHRTDAARNPENLARLLPALSAALLVAAGMGLSLSFWPGLMTWDSVRQYGQAVSGQFDDWHPPVMEWIWQRFIPLYPGPLPMLLLQLFLCAGGYALIVGWAFSQGRRKLGVALAACALMPLAPGLLGEVIKDSLTAAALLLATGLLLWRERHWGFRAGTILLVFFAATLRFNAFLAGPPLLIAALPPSWSRTRARMAGLAIGGAILLFVTMPIANRLVGAAPSGVEDSLIIFDLGGITEFSSTDVFPPMGLKEPVAVNHRCYSPLRWDPYSWWVARLCPIRFDTFRAAIASGKKPALAYWLEAIATHPIAYLTQRMLHWNANARFLVPDEIQRALEPQTVPNPWNCQRGTSAVAEFTDALAVASAYTPFGWPACWLALGCGVFILGRDLPSRRVILPILLSGLLYGLGYSVFSVASELRYYLWTMMAVLVAAVIALAEHFVAPGRGTRPLHLAAAPLAAVFVLCVLARYG
jgi:hypothetical protein